MKRSRKLRKISGLAACGAVAALLALPCPAATKEKRRPGGHRLAEQLQRAWESPPAAAASPGSLWSPNGHFANLASDYKARSVNDLITIRIVERTQARGSGVVQTQRNFEASSGISGLLGIVGARSGLQTLFSPGSERKHDGQAQTSLSTLLSTSLTGYVVAVLPNGSLVVEARRVVEMNQERQTLVIRGVVRPGDIAPDNSVLSTAISHLEVDLRGKGVISDGVRRPNRVVRFLLRVLGF